MYRKNQYFQQKCTEKLSIHTCPFKIFLHKGDTFTEFPGVAFSAYSVTISNMSTIFSRLPNAIISEVILAFSGHVIRRGRLMRKLETDLLNKVHFKLKGSRIIAALEQWDEMHNSEDRLYEISVSHTKWWGIDKWVTLTIRKTYEAPFEDDINPAKTSWAITTHKRNLAGTVPAFREISIEIFQDNAGERTLQHCSINGEWYLNVNNHWDD